MSGSILLLLILCKPHTCSLSFSQSIRCTRLNNEHIWPSFLAITLVIDHCYRLIYTYSKTFVSDYINTNNTIVWKLFNRKYFIDKKFKVKYYHGYMTSSKYFYLEHILLAIIHTTMHHLQSMMLLTNIITTPYHYYTYMTLLTLPFVQSRMQCGYFECASSIIV